MLTKSLMKSNNHLQNMAPSYWSERRIQYRNICILCDKMDDAISLITMVSFSNNLYFICVQLLRSLKWVHALNNIQLFSLYNPSQHYAFGGPCCVLLLLAHLSNWSHSGGFTVLLECSWWIQADFEIPALCAEGVLVSRGETIYGGGNQRWGGPQWHEVFPPHKEAGAECKTTQIWM